MHKWAVAKNLGAGSVIVIGAYLLITCCFLLPVFGLVVFSLLRLAAGSTDDYGLAALDVLGFTLVQLLILSPVLTSIFVQWQRIANLDPAAVFGYIVTEHRFPRLFAILSAVFEEQGVKDYGSVVILQSPEIFIANNRRDTLNGRTEKRSIFIGLQALHALNEEELKAVLAHEAAHFAGGDALFSSLVAPSFAIITAIEKEIHAYVFRESRNTVHLLGRVLLYPCALLLGGYLRLLKRQEASLSFVRELRADAIAASLHGSSTLVSAIAKIAALPVNAGTTESDEVDESPSRYPSFEARCEALGSPLPSIQSEGGIDQHTVELYESAFAELVEKGSLRETPGLLSSNEARIGDDAFVLRRLGAFGVDTFLLFFLIGALDHASRIGLFDFGPDDEFYILIMFVAAISYGVVLESGAGHATFGKRIFGLQVLRQGGAKTSVGYGVSIIRQLSKVVGLLAFGVGLIPLFFTRYRRTGWDFLSKTVVSKRFIERPSNDDLVATVAPFRRRFAAAILDILIILLPFVIGARVIASLTSEAFLDSPESETIGAFALLQASWLYFSSLECSKWRGTLGKAALGICVVDEWGRSLSFARASTRFAVRLLSVSSFFALPFFSALLSHRRRSIYDLWLGSNVVRSTPTPQYIGNVAPRRQSRPWFALVFGFLLICIGTVISETEEANSQGQTTYPQNHLSKTDHLCNSNFRETKSLPGRETH